jgi:hypothetical protein
VKISTTALLAVVVAVATIPATGQAQDQVTPLTSCGSIRVLGTRFAVDITEGRLHLTCEAARSVMRRYLTRGGKRSDSVRYQGMRFDCYRSRPGGAGWDFHCDRLTRTQYVDIGASRPLTSGGDYRSQLTDYPRTGRPTRSPYS